MSDFSIVTATFNAGGSIRRCLQSVRENRLAETEHLVKEDAYTYYPCNLLEFDEKLF